MLNVKGKKSFIVSSISFDLRFNSYALNTYLERLQNIVFQFQTYCNIFTASFNEPVEKILKIL